MPPKHTASHFFNIKANKKSLNLASVRKSTGSVLEMLAT